MLQRLVVLRATDELIECKEIFGILEHHRCHGVLGVEGEQDSLVEVIDVSLLHIKLQLILLHELVRFLFQCSQGLLILHLCLLSLFLSDGQRVEVEQCHHRQKSQKQVL